MKNVVKNFFFIYIPNTKLIFRDLNYINFFKNLNLKNCFFVFSDNKNIPKNLKNYKVIKFNKYRYKIWDFIHFLSRLSLEKKNFNSNIINQTLSIPKIFFIFSKIFFFLRIHKLVINLGNLLLKLSSPKFLENLVNFNKVICFGSSKDLNFDDIIRNTKKFNIHSSLIFTNWDNATTKPYLYKPDKVFCWGDETTKLSKKIHNINSESIGSIRFENHKKFKLKFQRKSQLSIIKKNALDTKYKYILFAGVTHPFDEIDSLDILDKHIEKNYKKIFKIIYRPHPFNSHIKKIKKKNFKNIILNIDKNKNNFEKYYFLLSSIEFIISPYSTLVLEGLYYYKPAICLAYNDNNRNIFNWYENSKYQPHLKIFKKNKFIKWCFSKEQLCNDFDFLVKKKNKFNKSSFDKIILRSVYFDKYNYMNRLKKKVFV